MTKNLKIFQASDDMILLVVTIKKKKQIFGKHVDNLCHKAPYEINALGQIKKFLAVEKAKILGNSFL